MAETTCQKNIQTAGIWVGATLRGWHAFQRTNVYSFVVGALIAASVVPAKVGRKAFGENSMECHAMKRMYRLLDNNRITMKMMRDVYLRRFKSYIASNKELILAFDWTVLHSDFNLLSVSLVTKKGRTIPILYDGYEFDKIPAFSSQNSIENGVLQLILEAIPKDKRVIFIADRGFDRPEIAKLFIKYNVRFVIRASTKVYIHPRNKRAFKLKRRTIARGELKDFETVTYTRKNPVTLRFIGYWAPRMKEAWYLLTNLTHKDALKIVKIYALRMEIEEMFKSKKNDQCGMCWKHSKLTTIDRWLRLAFIVSLVFQFFAEVAFACGKNWKVYENQFTLCRRKKRVFSIFSLALLLLNSARYQIETNRVGSVRLKCMKI